VESLNSSNNWATWCASGLRVSAQFNFSLHFCVVSGNYPANCLYFSCGIWHGDISCVVVSNNSCKSDFIWPGLVYLGSNVTLFQSNAFDYFLGGVGSVMFATCVFDVESLNATKNATFATMICVYETRQTSLPQCVATGTGISGPPSGDGTTNFVIMLAICIAGILLTIVASVVIVKRLAQLRWNQPTTVGQPLELDEQKVFVLSHVKICPSHRINVCISQ
jgi:hypothetical protein